MHDKKEKKEILLIKNPLEVKEGPAGKRGVVRPGGPPGKIDKMGPVGSKGERVVEKVTREMLVVLGNKEL